MEPTMLLLIVLLIPVALFLIGFWVWMLVDCLRYESSEGNDKIVWLLVIVFTKLIGAAIYYFVRRPQRMRLQAAGS